MDALIGVFAVVAAIAVVVFIVLRNKKASKLVDAVKGFGGGSKDDGNNAQQ